MTTQETLMETMALLQSLLKASTVEPGKIGGVITLFQKEEFDPKHTSNVSIVFSNRGYDNPDYDEDDEDSPKLLSASGMINYDLEQGLSIVYMGIVFHPKDGYIVLTILTD